MSPAPLRVLHILGELKPSGAETMILSAAPAFSDNGIEAEILSTGRHPGPFAERLHLAGYRIIHIPFQRSPLFFVHVAAVMRNGYNVIHLHTERANFWLGVTACLSPARLVLRTIHSSFDFDGGLRRKRGLQRRLLHAVGVRHVAISESVQKNEAVRFGLRAELVPNWYDSRRFQPPELGERAKARHALGIGSGDKVIVSIGNCSEAKNHRAMIEALALLPVAERPLYLHVGMEEACGQERALAERLGMLERIRFLGPLADVRPPLLASDLFVMPSLYEGFGIAAIEALATGLPAVFSDVPGLCDFREMFPGLFYAGTDAASLALALATALSLTPAELKSRAAGYPEVAQAHYGIEQGVTGYLNIYRQHGRTAGSRRGGS